MIYPSDFSFSSNNSQKKIKKNISVIKYYKNNNNLVLNNDESFLHQYCLSSTVHGLKYIVDKQFTIFER